MSPQTEGFPETAKSAKFAKICQNLPKSAKFAKICKNLQNLPKFAKICRIPEKKEMQRSENHLLMH
jgi:hypothetical protein